VGRDAANRRRYPKSPKDDTGRDGTISGTAKMSELCE
jgi:hypothetical protein